MRVYESTIAFHPEAGEVAARDLLERARQALVAEGAEVRQIFDWDSRPGVSDSKAAPRRLPHHRVQRQWPRRRQLERNLGSSIRCSLPSPFRSTPIVRLSETHGARRDGVSGRVRRRRSADGW